MNRDKIESNLSVPGIPGHHCRERPALYHESLDYLSMFLDQVYERLKDSRNLPFLCMLRILKRTEERCYEKKISQSEIKNEKRNNSEE